MFWTGLVIGVLAGTTFGVVVMGWMHMAAEADRQMGLKD